MTIRYDGAMEQIVEAARRIAADRDKVFALLTDYGSLANWLPGVGSARELAREGDVVVAELTAPTLGAPNLVLEIVHSPPAVAHFTRVDQYRGEGTSGTWELTEVDDGVELRVRVRPGPALAGARGRRRLRDGLEKALEAIERGLESAITEESQAVENEGRRKVLEVTRNGDTVVVWHRGRIFELPRRTEGD